MGLLELDVQNITEDERAFNDTAKRFAEEVMRPTSIALDKLGPEEVIAEGSVLWDAFREYRKIGFHKAAFPPEVGGLGLTGMTGILNAETFGWAASGLNICFGVAGMPFSFAAMSPDPDMQKLAKAYCEDEKAELIGCWAITEPDHGSDYLVDPNEAGKDATVIPQVRATLDGDCYVINGQKSAWVSDGTIATHACLFMCIDAKKGIAGSGIAIVPLDLPGVTRGKPLEKMGQRDLNQGEIFFSDVRLPKKYMVCEDPDVYRMMADRILTGANASMGTMFTGVAQSAYDCAVDYARERIQGGKPIIEHQNIKLKLFNMFAQVEAARSLSRRASRYNQYAMLNMLPPSLHYSIASKIFCTEVCFKVASEAITVFGGVGLTKEYPIEKIFRDARASMIEDGVNETLALGGSDWLFA